MDGKNKMESWNLTGIVTKTSGRFRPEFKAYLRAVNVPKDVRLMHVGASDEENLHRGLPV